MDGRDNGFCNSYGCLLTAIREMIAIVMTLACHPEALPVPPGGKGSLLCAVMNVTK